MRKKLKEQSPLLQVLPTEKPEVLVKKLHSFEGRIAEKIVSLSGSMYFIYFHIVAFTLFFILRPFEEQVFNILLSLEAVFLATFILVAQKRQAIVEEVRELADEQEEAEEEKEQEELEEDVQDIQKDLDDIKNAMAFIQQKITSLEKTPSPPENNPK